MREPCGVYLSQESHMFGEMVFVEARTQESLRARWSRAASLIAQLSALSFLVLLSFARPELPEALRINTHPVLAPPRIMPLVAMAPKEPNTASSAVSYSPLNIAQTNVIQVPSHIPHGIARDEGPPVATSLHGCPSCTGAGSSNALNSIIGSGPATVVKPAAPKSVRVSHMDPGSLIKRVQPTYPAIAKIAHIQGAVVLQAVISREGTIESLHVLSGHPSLVNAAIDAVQQWRYRPYVSNGTPVEVETQITVNFSLGNQ
jgi:periplasmic protein TonB